MLTSQLTYKAGVSRPLVEEIMNRSGQNLLACYQCRRCAAGCSVGEETGVTPDRLIRMVMLGDKEAAMNNLLVGKCVACYTCGSRCPNTIQTARITETLKQMGKKTGSSTFSPRISDFHESFMTSTKHFGRFNEMEGMAIYEAKTAVKETLQGRLSSVIGELISWARLGAEMARKKRMHFGINRMKNRSEVKALYKKAKLVKIMQEG